MGVRRPDHRPATSRSAGRASPPRMRAEPARIEAHTLGKQAAYGTCSSSRTSHFYCTIEIGAEGHSLPSRGRDRPLIGSKRSRKVATLRSISGLTPPRVGSIEHPKLPPLFTARTRPRPRRMISCHSASRSPRGTQSFRAMSFPIPRPRRVTCCRDEDVDTDLDASLALPSDVKERENRRRGLCPVGEHRCSRWAAL